MSTSLMFVVLACCCFETSKADAPTASTDPILTISHSSTGVVMKCAVGTDVLLTADKVAFKKGTAELSYKSDTDKTDGTIAFGSGNTFMTRTVVAADSTNVCGDWTCGFKIAAIAAANGAPAVEEVETKESAAVKYHACSSAPRVVESLSMALVCVLATVLKSHM